MPSNNTTIAAPTPEARPPFKLIHQITAYRTSQCIRAVVDLGIPARLEKGPASAEALAKETGTHTPLLTRILDHLVAEEVFARTGDGNYMHTPDSRYLLPNHPRSMHPWVSCELHPLYWRSWEQIVEQLRTGKPGFDLAHDQPFFGHLAGDEAAQKRFDDQMRGAAMAMGAAAVESLTFSDGMTIVDVGGGDGSLLAQTLQKNPGTRGILFELPRALEEYHPLFADYRASGRASVEHGSFFDTMPSGANAYVFSRVFHDFDDDAVMRVLHTARAVMTGGEQLYLIDIMSDGATPSQRGSSQDIFMMVQLGGRERTAGEFSGMLAGAGFEPVAITKTASPLSILEFRPAG